MSVPICRTIYCAFAVGFGMWSCNKDFAIAIVSHCLKKVQGSKSTLPHHSSYCTVGEAQRTSFWIVRNEVIIGTRSKVVNLCLSTPSLLFCCILVFASLAYKHDSLQLGCYRTREALPSTWCCLPLSRIYCRWISLNYQCGRCDESWTQYSIILSSPMSTRAASMVVKLQTLIRFHLHLALYQ
jgi:hypothetical protein